VLRSVILIVFLFYATTGFSQNPVRGEHLLYKLFKSSIDQHSRQNIYVGANSWLYAMMIAHFIKLIPYVFITTGIIFISFLIVATLSIGLFSKKILLFNQNHQYPKNHQLPIQILIIIKSVFFRKEIFSIC
jgi:hypothetical protein